MEDFYRMLCAKLSALVDGERNPVPNMANAAALLFQDLERINWAGFYTMTDGGYLLLAPFQGKPACIRIPFGKGVCGTAAETDSTQLVDDVHSFSGHIACDAASRSEIVVPIHGRDGSVVAVLDIDSPETARFTKEDKAGLEEVARIMEKACDWH
ncbi:MULTISPECIES: GAF domain-containing protein [Treponema]|uniref:GAF domain-containing protein n=1 Tax=Treponema TaxID=157 RepID=UPI00257A19DC|nr:GAF domain-containing protein [Treponema sp.]MBQ5536472.1 GAF domain-containing protein [Treponema sp.]